MDANLKLAIVEMVRSDFIVRNTMKFFEQQRILAQWADYIYDTIAETTEFKKLLASPPPYPYSWEINDFDIDSVAGDSIFGVFARPYPFTMNFSNPKPWMDFVPVDDLKPLIRVESNRGGHPLLALLDHPKWAEFHKAVIEYNKILKTAEDNFQNLLMAVDKICDHYDTINEAVAAWPALRHLLPEHQQKQDLPFEGMPKPLPDSVDITELTALVARAKLEV